MFDNPLNSHGGAKHISDPQLLKKNTQLIQIFLFFFADILNIFQAIKQSQIESESNRTPKQTKINGDRKSYRMNVIHASEGSLVLRDRRRGMTPGRWIERGTEKEN